MQRFENWPIRLEHYLQAHSSERFAYGRMDCCLFVCGAIAAMTGIDPAASFRGRYQTGKEAKRELQRYSGDTSVRTVTERITAEFGMEEIPTLKAQRGDLLLIPRRRDYSLGLVSLDGRMMAVLTRTQGLWLLPVEAERAWRV